MSIRANIYRQNIEGALLHQFLGVTIETIGEGQAKVTIPINDHTLNPAGSLHGGVIYLVADVAAFAAIGSVLSEAEFAVTIDMQCSIYQGTTSNPVTFNARVTRRTRRLAFMNVEVIDGQGNVIAESRVTKAITHTVPEIFRG